MDLNPDISGYVFLVEEGDMRIIEDIDQPTSSSANNSNSNEANAAPKNNEKLDLSESESSLKRYFQYSKGSVDAKCRVCSKKISRKDQSPSGMISHMKAIHKKHFEAYSDSKSKVAEKRSYGLNSTEAKSNAPKQMRITDFKPPVIDEKTSKKIDDKIMRFICKSCEPLMLSEKKGFSDILAVACPRLHSVVKFYLYNNM